MAMLLGAARLLVDRRADLPGRVLLMFQPGEEGLHGARYMLEEGLLDGADTPPTGAFAIHTMAMYPSGTINIRPGPMLAAGDTLHVTIEGRGGHASMPHRAVDPVTVAAEMILAFQTMVGRRVDVFDPAVVTIAQMTAGTTTNVIAESAYLGWDDADGLRGDPARRSRAEVRRVADGIAAAHGAGVRVEIEPGYPVTLNDPDFTDTVVDEARSLLGDERVRIMPAPIMGAEDFSYVLERVPGAMAFLGARPDDLDPTHRSDEPLESGGLRRVGDGRRRRDPRRRCAAASDDPRRSLDCVSQRRPLGGSIKGSQTS